MAATPAPRALEGLRVLDLATPLGEATGRVLADLGAEVIKIEPPGGCESRFTPPLAKGGGGDPEGSFFWQAWGLGKRSVIGWDSLVDRPLDDLLSRPVDLLARHDSAKQCRFGEFRYLCLHGGFAT